MSRLEWLPNRRLGDAGPHAGVKNGKRGEIQAHESRRHWNPLWNDRSVGCTGTHDITHITTSLLRRRARSTSGSLTLTALGRKTWIINCRWDWDDAFRPEGVQWVALCCRRTMTGSCCGRLVYYAPRSSQLSRLDVSTGDFSNSRNLGLLSPSMGDVIVLSPQPSNRQLPTFVGAPPNSHRFALHIPVLVLYQRLRNRMNENN